MSELFSRDSKEKYNDSKCGKLKRVLRKGGVRKTSRQTDRQTDSNRIAKMWCASLVLYHH